MTARDVCEYFAASREWLRLRILHSGFPQPVRLGSEGPSGHRRWSLASIMAWEQSRLSANDNTQTQTPESDTKRPQAPTSAKKRKAAPAYPRNGAEAEMAAEIDAEAAAKHKFLQETLAAARAPVEGEITKAAAKAAPLSEARIAELDADLAKHRAITAKRRATKHANRRAERDAERKKINAMMAEDAAKAAPVEVEAAAVLAPASAKKRKRQRKPKSDYVAGVTGTAEQWAALIEKSEAEQVVAVLAPVEIDAYAEKVARRAARAGVSEATIRNADADAEAAAKANEKRHAAEVVAKTADEATP
jgi:predicted DNA-binding transcriptional regulator AlpA